MKEIWNKKSEEELEMEWYNDNEYLLIDMDELDEFLKDKEDVS